MFTISRIIIATTTVVPFCFQGHLWGGFPSTKNFSRRFNTMILVSLYAFLLFNRFLHAQIIIFIVVYWKACDISWKWYTTVNICLFSHFNLTFYLRKQQKLKSSNEGVQQVKNYITLEDCLILVWKSSNSYYKWNSTFYVM